MNTSRDSDTTNNNKNYDNSNYNANTNESKQPDALTPFILNSKLRNVWVGNGEPRGNPAYEHSIADNLTLSEIYRLARMNKCLANFLKVKSNEYVSDFLNHVNKGRLNEAKAMLEENQNLLLESAKKKTINSSENKDDLFSAVQLAYSNGNINMCNMILHFVKILRDQGNYKLSLEISDFLKSARVKKNENQILNNYILAFDIDILKSDIENGNTNINNPNSLSLLFSNEHKRETFYWLYEHKDLIAQITPENLKPHNEILKKTKKGQNILSFVQGQNVIIHDGIFKRPDLRATQLGQYAAYGDMINAERIVKAANSEDLNKKILNENVTVMDYSGRKFKNKTAFQIALCACDVKLHSTDPDAMCEMLARYMTKEDVESQFNKIFPEGHHKFFKKQEPFDFTEIIKSITDAGAEEVQKALKLTQPQETALWKALEKFRNEFNELSKKEIVWNPQHLIVALNKIDEHYANWSSNQGIKQKLFWRQVIGYTQRFMPANIAMDFAQGLYGRLKEKKKPLRTFNFQYGDGAIYPLNLLSLSGLGFKYAAEAGHNTERALQASGEAPVLKELCQAKAAILENLCSPHQIQNLKAGF